MRRAGGALAVMLCVAATGCAWKPFAFLDRDSASGRLRSSDYGLGKAFGNSLVGDTTPGVYVDRLIQTVSEKRIEQRTVRQRAAGAAAGSEV